MGKYICENIFVPLRYGPSHKSEMLSQILFGEKYLVEGKSGNWLKIRNVFNDFVGWIDSDHIRDSFDEKDMTGYVLNKSLLCYKNDKTKLILEAGCEIFEPDFEKQTFSLGKNTYTTEKEFNRSYISTNNPITDTAMKFINSPYLWGGRISSGIDCSGFTQLVYKIHGISIPHSSWQQSEMGKIVDFIEESVVGDLVFFDNDRGNITHVGMILSKGLVIHASGRVRIDSIDHVGIFNHETEEYSHKLRTIKRII
jgi:gamma-D-glutamyl-L-lysine dipeptidyl-peptidase